MLQRVMAGLRSAIPSMLRRYRMSHERGLASVEFMAAMPVFVTLIAGIILIAGLAYYHLALLTTANDCAVVASHEPAQYYSTANLVQGAYRIDSNVTLHYEAGGPLMACSAFTNVWPGLGVWYTIHMPLQPYSSIWPP